MATINGRPAQSQQLDQQRGRQVAALWTRLSRTNERITALENLVKSLVEPTPEKLAEVEAFVAINLADIKGVTASIEAALRAMGIEGVEQLAEAEPQAIADGVKGVGVKTAERLIKEAQSVILDPPDDAVVLSE